MLALALLASPVAAQERMGFSRGEIQAHRLVGSDEIRVPAGIQPNFDSIDGIEVEIEISSAGDVTEARLENHDGGSRLVPASGDGSTSISLLCSLR